MVEVGVDGAGGGGAGGAPRAGAGAPRVGGGGAPLHLLLVGYLSVHPPSPAPRGEPATGGAGAQEGRRRPHRHHRLDGGEGG